MTTKIFTLTQSHRANRDMGAVRTVDTDTVTEVDGGLRVDTHVKGVVEGTQIDRRSTSFYAGVTMEKATAYRLKQGYVLVSERS